jgi:hypothetical protein
MSAINRLRKEMTTMQKAMIKFKDSSFFRLYKSFTPASRAAILFLIPFTLVDAIHYYTAGTALIFSFPLLALVYIVCGTLAARIARMDDLPPQSFPRVSSSAALRLMLASTVINTLVSLLLGFLTLGSTLLSGMAYLCLFMPFHALGSFLAGWLGGWLYQQILHRTSTSP